MGDSLLSDLFEEAEFGETNLAGAASPEDLFSILETLRGISELTPLTPLDEALTGPQNGEETAKLVSQRSTSSSAPHESETEVEASPICKRAKLLENTTEEVNPDGQQKVSHITVERNRRKQMNEHLTVLRSLMPSFYVKRGDQASIIGGVVDYIKELQQVLQSLEAKKQRKVYSEVLSPRLVSSSPRPSPLSPRKPSLSPRMSLPVSPRTPQPSSPYKPRLQQGYLSPTMGTSHELSFSSSSMPRLQQGYLSPTMATSHELSSSSSSTINDNVKELAANSKSAVADVEVKFSSPNVLLKTVSPRIPGQATKIIAAIEDLSLEVLHVNISTSTIDETMLHSFTIKIGIECQLSAEELAQEIQRTFS